MDDTSTSYAGNASRKKLTAREAAYLALLSAMQGKGYIHYFLEKWDKDSVPSRADFHLASEIAYGCSRMALALNHLAVQLTVDGKLSLKLKERALLYTALYQHYFMSKIPLYALCNESVFLAKRYCHFTFVKFLNALLRKLEHTQLTLPQGDSPEDLSVRYSYPLLFVEKIIQSYDFEITRKILIAGNHPSITQFRVRDFAALSQLPLDSYVLLPPDIAVLKDTAILPLVTSRPAFYVQNQTPIELMRVLSKGAPNPSKILDLCASPGGKLLLAHDLFPTALLYANDVSREKLDRVVENTKKYTIDVVCSCSPGEILTLDKKFDLIIVDAPCSNTGVLNKRPEARWRLSEQTLEETIALQVQLLKNASTLLSDRGEIWYLTCSILKEENEGVVDQICRHLPLKCRIKETYLPSLEGSDGGFGCVLTVV